MDATNIGGFRYCPACGRPVLPPDDPSEDPDREAFDWEAPRCAGCGEHWIACPCAPAEEDA